MLDQSLQLLKLIQCNKILPSTPENSVTASSRDTLAESSYFTDNITRFDKADLDAHSKQIYYHHQSIAL